MKNPYIDGNGTTIWYNSKKQIHRDVGPAIEYYYGGKEWRINGVLHREDGPAYEMADGYKQWYIEGKLIR